MEELLQDKFFRFAILLVLFIVMIATFQWEREIYEVQFGLFYNILSVGPIRATLKVLNKISPFQLLNPLLYIKLEMSLLKIFLTMSIIKFWFMDARITRLSFRFILAWFVGALLINVFAKTFGMSRVLFHAHNTMDLLLSPYAVTLLVPVMILYKRSVLQKK